MNKMGNKDCKHTLCARHQNTRFLWVLSFNHTATLEWALEEYSKAIMTEGRVLEEKGETAQSHLNPENPN